MDAEGILYAVIAIANWRAVVTLALFSVIAWLLVFAAPVMVGLQAIVFAFTGLFVGALWQEHRSVDVASNQPDKQTRPSVAAASSALLSLCWGLVSAETLHSTISGAVILSIALLAHTKYYRRINLISSNRARLCICFAALGYAVGTIARNFTA
ncbi:MAG: hypothetical protein ACH34Y_08950 [Brachymonas sp.]